MLRVGVLLLDGPPFPHSLVAAVHLALAMMARVAPLAVAHLVVDGHPETLATLGHLVVVDHLARPGPPDLMVAAVHPARLGPQGLPVEVALSCPMLGTHWQLSDRPPGSRKLSPSKC